MNALLLPDNFKHRPQHSELLHYLTVYGRDILSPLFDSIERRDVWLKMELESVGCNPVDADFFWSQPPLLLSLLLLHAAFTHSST